MKISECCPGKTWQACFEQLRIIENNSAPAEATANAMMAATATAVTAATIDAAASSGHIMANYHHHHHGIDMDGVTKAVTI